MLISLFRASHYYWVTGFTITVTVPQLELNRAMADVVSK